MTDFFFVVSASGAQTIFVVSAPYMDDGVSQKDSPLFFGEFVEPRAVTSSARSLCSTCLTLLMLLLIGPLLLYKMRIITSDLKSKTNTTLVI